MNIRQQLFIDNYIAKPIAFFFNFLVRALGSVLSINHDLDREFKTIAVSKFKGMGSILQATPMLSAIKKKYPQAEIVFVSSKSNITILEKIDLIDTIVIVDDSSFYKFFISNIKSILFLMKKHPEIYFDLEIYSDYSTLFTLFSLSINRVGFYLRSSSFRMGIYTHMMFFNPRVPIADVYLQLVQLIGCKKEDLELYPLMKSIKSLPKRERRYIVINPNSSDLRLERRWAQSNFVELIIEILANFSSFNILLIGGKGDEESYSQEIADRINNERVINMAGKTSIEEAIAIVDAADLMVTNDTGPMHIAFCLDTTVICLFGPCSPDQYGISKNAHIIYKPVYCSPCVHDFEVAPCNGDNVCMKLITTDEVYQKVSELLIDSNKSPQHQEQKEFIYRDEANVFGKVNR